MMAMGTDELPARWPWSLGVKMPVRTQSMDDYVPSGPASPASHTPGNQTPTGNQTPGTQTPPTSQPAENQLGSVFNLLSLNQPRIPRRTFSGDEFQGWQRSRISRNTSEMSLDAHLYEGGGQAGMMRRGSNRTPRTPRRQMSAYEPSVLYMQPPPQAQDDQPDELANFEPQLQSQLLALPAEIRLQIYRDLLDITEVPVVYFQSHCLKLRPSARGLCDFDDMRRNLQALVSFCRSCKQVREEMAPLLADAVPRFRIVIDAHFIDVRELLERVRLARGVEWRFGAVDLERFVEYHRLPSPDKSGRLDMSAVEEYLERGGDPNGVIPSYHSYGILPDGKIDPATGEWYPLVPERHTWAP